MRTIFKLRLFLAGLIVGVLIGIPSLVMGGGLSIPYILVGTVSDSGRPVQDGSILTIFVGKTEAASVTVQDGNYFVSVNSGEFSWNGQPMSFKLNNQPIVETATYTSGGADILSLTVERKEIPDLDLELESKCLDSL